MWSKYLIQAVATVGAIGICSHCRADDNDTVIELRGEEVPEDFAENVMAPMRANVLANRSQILDAEILAYIAKPHENKRRVEESLVRSVISSDGESEYFVRVNSMPETLTEEELTAALKAELLEARLYTAKSPDERLRLAKELMDEKEKFHFDPGGAYLFDGENYRFHLFGRAGTHVAKEEAAKSLSGFSPFRVSPLLTAADMTFGTQSSEGSFGFYNERPSAVDIKADGSNSVTWQRKKLRRTVYFDATQGGLPSKLIDIYDNRSGMPCAETTVRWHRRDNGPFQLESVETVYRSPHLIREKGYLIRMSISFSWSKRESDKYFDPATVGTHMPFEGRKEDSNAEQRARLFPN